MKRILGGMAAAMMLSACMIQPFAVTAMTDACELFYAKIQTSVVDAAAVHANAEYYFLDDAQNALAFLDGKFYQEKPLTDEDGTYYSIKNEEAVCSWKFMVCSNGSDFTIRPFSAQDRYLSCQDGKFSLTMDEKDAATFSIRTGEKVKEGLPIYCNQEKAYLQWKDGTLSLSKDAVGTVMHAAAKQNQLQFYYQEGNQSTATAYCRIASWAGDGVTLPEIPKQENKTPVCWQQINPQNASEVTAEYQPGEVLIPTDAVTVFLARYDQQQSELIPVGTSYEQSVTLNLGQEITIQLGKNGADTYLLFDGSGSAEQISAKEAEDGTKSVTVTASAERMYLCAAEVQDEKPMIQIKSLYDLTQVRDMINLAENAGSYDMILKADIDMEGICSAETGSWKPIASSDCTTPCHIGLYGNYHTIRNLYVNAMLMNGGLFGNVSDLYVSRLTLQGNVKGDSYQGGLVGNCGNLKCEETIMKTDVSAIALAGGFAGNVTDTMQLYDCGFMGNIACIGKSSSGLFAAEADSALISDCFAMGSIGGCSENQYLGRFHTAKINAVYVQNDICAGAAFPESGRMTAVAAEDFCNGTVAGMLNGEREPAVWSQAKDSPIIANGVYNLLVQFDKSGGSLSIPKTIYEAGESVIFTAKASEGYTLSITAAIQGTATELTVSPTGEADTWIFRMPASDVSLNIGFTKDEPVKLIPGDASNDGNVDVADAVLVARVLAEDSTAVISTIGQRQADVNNSGQLDAEDISLILRYVARLITFTTKEQ
ncbi:MAG: dockerin type I repeat-containing protein [Oscillospiraceae bacterium]|nr:dockerin type I repeat-containing protein [Oscillospiraceae bacterium]